MFGRLITALVLCLGLNLGVSAANAAIDAPSGAYGLDKTHAYITLTYSHLGFSNPHVGFNDFDVALTLDANEPSNSSVVVTIQAASRQPS